MKPTLTVDLDGALLKSRPFDEAHKRWFYVMSVLLKDDSINQYAGLDNYFDKVHEVMERYLGDVNHETRVKFARNLFSMATIAEVTKNDLVQDFADYLRELKERYSLTLITTAPEASVDPILQKIDCNDIFEIVYKSPMDKHPNKKELFEAFIKEYGIPKYYLGDGDDNMNICKGLGISTISVNWVSKAKIKGDYDVDTVEELRNILYNK